MPQALGGIRTTSRVIVETVCRIVMKIAAITMKMKKQSLRRIFDRWLPRSGFARSVSILVGGTALAQALAVAVSPILTRIYKPSEFGALQVFISLLALVVVAASGRYEVAILLPEDDQSAVDVLGVAILCVGLATTICAGIVLICHYHWILPSSVLVLKGYLWLLPFSVLGGGVYQVLNYWAMRRGNYKQIAKSKFTQVGAQVATQLGVGLLVHGPFGLLIGDAMGRMSGSGRFIRDLWRDYADKLRALRISRMVKCAMRYREYPLVSMWGALINASGMALPSLFLAQYYGAEDTGWFALVNRVLGVPAVLIGFSIAQVYASEAAKLSRSDPKRLMYIFLKTTRHMLYLGLVPCVVFTILAPWLFQFIFGHAWREAGVYARYLAFMFYASFIDSPVTMTLNILERQRAQFAWDISRLILIVIAIALPYHLGYGPRVVVQAYGVAMTVMYGIHWTQSYFGIGRRVRQAAMIVTNAAQA
jgi:O-antigen/teichoic acid export membrane protein